MNSLLTQSPQELWAQVLEHVDKLAVLQAEVDLVSHMTPQDLVANMQRQLEGQGALVRCLQQLRERGALHDVADLLELTYGRA